MVGLISLLLPGLLLWRGIPFLFLFFGGLEGGENRVAATAEKANGAKGPNLDVV